MSAKKHSNTLEWELILTNTEARRASDDIEIEMAEAVEEPLPAPQPQKQVVIVVNTAQLAEYAGKAAVPIGGTVMAVLYFETIITILAYGLGVVAAVVVLGQLFKAIDLERQERRRRQRDMMRSGWKTGQRQHDKTMVNQSAETIINHFH